MRLRFALLALLAFVFSACGYHLVRYGGADAPQQRVAIETFRNDSFEPGLEYVVNDALQREFLRRGAVDLVQDPERADFIIGGTVLPVLARAEGVSSVNFALEFELILRLVLTVKRSDGEEVPFDERSLTESEFYLASADVEVTRKNRGEALHAMATMIAGRIHDTLVETAIP